jgi:hypothetical protein
MLSTISAVVGEAALNIENMLSKSAKGADIQYTILDLNALPKDPTVRKLKETEGILRVRVLKI